MAEGTDDRETFWNQRTRSQIEAQRMYGQKGEYWDNYAIAQNTLRQEMEHGPRYGFDKDQNDRLIAHARQDAAHAVCNAQSLLNAMKRTLRLLWIAILLLVALIAAVMARH
jgi:hypothetical protein